MPPDDRAQDTDTDQAANQESITEHRLASKHRGYLGRHCHGGESNHVYPGGPPKPEKVLIKPVAPATGGKGEGRIEDPGHPKHDLRDHERKKHPTTKDDR